MLWICYVFSSVKLVYDGGIFKTSSLCDSFIAACYKTDDGSYWVCVWVGGMVCVGNKSGMNVKNCGIWYDDIKKIVFAPP